MLNIDMCSPSSWAGRSSGFKGLAPFLARVPQSLSCHVVCGVASGFSVASILAGGVEEAEEAEEAEEEE